MQISILQHKKLLQVRRLKTNKLADDPALSEESNLVMSDIGPHTLQELVLYLASLFLLLPSIFFHYLQKRIYFKCDDSQIL